jgi:RNA polymerase sigma-70 factor (ECF subfamily)
MTTPSTHVSLLQALGEEVGREHAWDLFLLHYRELIHGWCRRGGLDPHAAEDLTQEILIRLLEALPRHRHDPDRGRFRSWLRTVVRHALADRGRRHKRRPEAGGVGGSTALERLADLPGPAAVGRNSAAEGCTTAAGRAGVLDRVRARVEPTNWEAFRQRMVEGRPAAEVAAELGITVGAVYKAAERIKRMVIQEGRDAASPTLHE